tara:strand:- start:106 stop:390 length:285 start_codon:yes stop_codon:yes gene_type:complete
LFYVTVQALKDRNQNHQGSDGNGEAETACQTVNHNSCSWFSSRNVVQKVITERIPRIIAAPRNSGERIIFIILEDNGIAGMFHFRIRQSPFENF